MWRKKKVRVFRSGRETEKTKGDVWEKVGEALEGARGGLWLWWGEGWRKI